MKRVLNVSSTSSALSNLQASDVLTVWKLDRLGRSLPHLTTVIEELQSKGAGFKSLSESIDTTTAGGKLIFHIFGALAEFERSLIAERTRAGLQARQSIRPPYTLDIRTDKSCRKMIDSGQETVSGIAELYGVDRSTIHGTLKRTVNMAKSGDITNIAVGND